MIDITKNPIKPPYITQNMVELEAFVNFLETINPSYIMEIGVWNWGTAWIWLEFCKRNDGVLYALDNDPSVFTRVKYRGKRLQSILGDSTSKETIRMVKLLIPNRSLDLLFIDGNHTLPYVQSDYENYRSLVREGGVIAFHDIIDDVDDPVDGVHTLWNKIKTETSLEFIDVTSEKHTPGIGVLLV